MTSVLTLEAPNQADAALLASMEQAKQIISGVRAIRQSKNIAPREEMTLEVVEAEGAGHSEAVELVAVSQLVAVCPSLLLGQMHSALL